MKRIGTDFGGTEMMIWRFWHNGDRVLVDKVLAVECRSDSERSTYVI